MAELFALFHFLRPYWLLAFLPVIFIWWQVRPKHVRGGELVDGIAPHLARALTVGRNADGRFWPIDGVALALGLLILAAAGPTWSRVDNPLLAHTAPLAVALKVTPSMENIDVQPTRLERAAFKILDLIERRAGAQTALFAYAGSAHRVTPLTEDPNILWSYLFGLDPAIMPESGDRADRALALAAAELTRSETLGAILFVLDDMSTESLAAFNEDATERPPVIFLVVAGPGVEVPGLAEVQNAAVVRISPDDSDLDQVERRVLSAYRAALLDDPKQAWEDRGWLLGWLALFLFLPWFRRGWTMRWGLVFVLLAPLGTPAKAEGWRDWFLTPDQQGQIALNNRDYAVAAALFQDPERRAYALLRAGRYEEAAEAYSFIETADAAVAEGVALLRSRQYRAGVRAFEKALERDPGHVQAAANLDVAQAIVEYVEAAQLSGDTGEEGGIGADDVVFDNESGQGVDMIADFAEAEEGAAGLTVEDWMRAVDTQVGDFLASRFLLETLRQAE